MKKTGKIILAVITAGVLSLSGCGNGDSIEGTWVLTEEIEADGNKIDSKELEEIGVAETYVISGTEVKYTCEAELIKKPIEITFTLEELGDNKYKFKYGDGFDFATVEVKGNTLSYEVGEEEPTKMIFKRQK